jgi:transcriptional antiterminator RfaH
MPILAQECDIFPEDLLVREQLDGNAEACWWAVYTRSRQEKELMRGLLRLEVPFYCPIVPQRFRSPGGRSRTSYLPLFRNYLFMHCDGYDRYRALKTNVISRTIEVKNGPELTRDLRQIQRLIELGAPLTLEAQLQPGTRVRIKNGPLTGIEGLILKRQGQNHLLVAVNFLQQGASIKLDDFAVERIT